LLLLTQPPFDAELAAAQAEAELLTRDDVGHDGLSPDDAAALHLPRLVHRWMSVSKRNPSGDLHDVTCPILLTIAIVVA
jgi:hypothetical protein